MIVENVLDFVVSLYTFQTQKVFRMIKRLVNHVSISGMILAVEFTIALWQKV